MAASRVKFYARHATIKNLIMSARGDRIFDSDFCYGSIQESSFDNAEFDNCDVSYATFNNVSFEDSYFYRLITFNTRFVACDFTEAYTDDFTFDCCTFRECNFSRCYMQDVTFNSCSFYNCDFNEAVLPPFFYPDRMVDCTNIPYMPMACPEEGEIIGYKIASTKRLCLSGSIWNENHGPANVLVTLKIPADAKRSSAGGRKCRCDKAEVIGLEHITSHENLSEAISKYDINFVYRIGEKISVPDFDENRWTECSSGIHFFINRKEALQYYGVMEKYYGSK